MADDSEKWLQRQKLNRQSSKDGWPYGDADSPGSPGRSRRREGDEESHKPSSAELLKRGSEGGAAREGRPSQAWSPSQGRGRAVLSCVWVFTPSFQSFLWFQDFVVCVSTLLWQPTDAGKAVT